MPRTLIALIGLAGAAVLSATTAAGAFPMAPIGSTETLIEKAAIVCNDWGRCWRTGPRYYRYGYYGPRRYWGPRYGYYGGPYYGGPGVSVGGPGFGFRFGY